MSAVGFRNSPAQLFTTSAKLMILTFIASGLTALTLIAAIAATVLAAMSIVEPVLPAVLFGLTFAFFLLMAGSFGRVWFTTLKAVIQ